MKYIELEKDKLCERIDSIAESIKKNLKRDETFKQSIEKFASTYETLSSKNSNAYLTSAFHRFGWCFGGSITRQQGGVLRRGKRIAIRQNLLEGERQTSAEEKERYTCRAYSLSCIQRESCAQ